jgi:hypothetical protein
MNELRGSSSSYEHRQCLRMLQASYSEDKLTGSSRLGVNNSALVGKRLLGGAYKRNKSNGYTPFYYYE